MSSSLLQSSMYCLSFSTTPVVSGFCISCLKIGLSFRAWFSACLRAKSACKAPRAVSASEIFCLTSSPLILLTSSFSALLRWKRSVISACFDSISSISYLRPQVGQMNSSSENVRVSALIYFHSSRSSSRCFRYPAISLVLQVIE